MRVEMSLGEMLINAIAHGKIPGVQFKRGWSDDRATFEGLKVVIANRLDAARAATVESELRRLHDEHPHFKLLRKHEDVERETVAKIAKMIRESVWARSAMGPEATAACLHLADAIEKGEYRK